MTHWSILHGDILDVQADGLLCSANPSLNLSGGVGGAFLLKYGPEMQTFLHLHLHNSNTRFIQQGIAVVAPPCGSPYHAVAHAVAINAFYETSIDWITKTYQHAIAGLTAAGCRTIASACLGCGYGRCPTDDFTVAVTKLMALPFPRIERITLVTTNRELVEALSPLI